ncbi:hypothetical protein RMATCC62417_12073 [Rhizopus microsporus]|nr:hypothetical protein RMATCC62417_12073 [Rhizopus microsporus]
MSATLNRLPLIPLSPLVQTSIESAKYLAAITQNLSDHPDDIRLQKHLSSTREKLDQITKHTQTIQMSFLTQFSAQEIAQEIAYINSQLFQLVALDSAWIANYDKRVNVIPMLDFHRYLSHAFAHEIICSSSRNDGNIVAHLIQIATTLLFVYRDFSGCTAILKCLQMPEIQRIEDAWSQCPPKMIKVFKELLPLISPDNQYEVYRQALWSLTHKFLDIPPMRSRMVAIPFMHAHFQVIQTIPSTVQILEFCQQLTKIDPSLLGPTASSVKFTQDLKKPSVDLEQLHTNPAVYHWLVSRAYLTYAQLRCESLHVIPLTAGERLPEIEEEHDMYWKFFRLEEEEEENDEALKDVEMKLIKTQEDITDQVQDPSSSGSNNKVDDSDNHTTTTAFAAAVADDNDNDAMEIVDTELLVIESSKIESTNEIDKLDESNARTQQDNQIIATKEIAIPDTASQNNTEDVETISDKVQQESLPVKENAIVKEEEEEEIASKDDMSSISSDKKPGDKENAYHSEESINNTSKLSSEEFECIDQSASSTNGISTESDIVVSDKDDTNDQNLAVSHTMPDHAPTTTTGISPEEDENDEEWTGYPYDDSAKEQDDEDEEWTGYPVSTPDEEEDEEEIWKGYPAPEQHIIEECNPSFVPWDKRGQLQAIGKAAARRMQHSLSSTAMTETARKRLPSSFGQSSAST